MKLTTEDLLMDNDRLTRGLHRIYVISATAALIVLGLIYYVFHISNQLNKTHSPWLRAVTELELEVTKAHLRFEEIMSGDTHEDVKTVWKHLRQADRFAGVMLERGGNGQNTFVPLQNEQMKKGVTRVRKKLEEFGTLMEQRVETKESSAAGSHGENLFDSIYNDLLDECDKLETDIKLIIQEEVNRLHLVQKGLLGACPVIFLSLGFIYRWFNRGRSVVMQILRESKERLEKVIEERKETEKAIQFQYEEMQKRLLEIAEQRDLDEERLADLNLANEQLRIAIDETDTENRDKSEFFAGMTHEIRTPANAIIDLTYISLDTQLDDEQRDKINTIKESAYSILSLLDSYLDILKIESGNLELTRTEFNIQSMLDRVVMTLSPQAHKKGIELRSQVDTNVVAKVIGDKGRLWQIMIHLVGNAIKFTVDGKIELQVKRVYFGNEGDRGKDGSEAEQILLQFSVCDTGIGIPEEKLVGIFEHFNRTDNPAINEYGETRLGLHVANKLVHMMGGEIWVESQEGEGSSFHFTTMFDLASESEKHEPLSDAAIDETGSFAGTKAEYKKTGEFLTR